MKKILYLLIFLFGGCPLLAQNNQFDMDSTLYVYYQKCEDLGRTSQVFSVADTLFRMAEKVGDKRTQAAALCHKANYYYYVEQNMDSLEKYTKIVRDFAKKTGQPKYYYWIWGRYIDAYINARQFNLALLELKEMQKEATEEDYIPGLISGYKQMMLIYNVRNNSVLAHEYMKKVIGLTEQYNIDDFNLSILYSNMAGILIGLDELDEAFPYIEKAYKAVKIPSQLFTAKKMEVYYWSKKKDEKRMLSLLKEIEAMDVPSRKNDVRQAWNYYYLAVRNYREASNLYDSIYKYKGLTKRHYLQGKASSLKYVPGKEKEAIECYDALVALQDSLNGADAQTSLAEFATLMDVSRLNKENSSLELAVSQQKLRSIYIFLIGLCVFFAATGIFTIKVLRLNRKLRASEANLLKKNYALTEAEKVIVKEKERAESASRMKSAFIQNMSHEIRTPLNSIVGFSQVLAEELKGQEEMNTYAQIIIENSNNLLKLVSDVIELSSLDTMDKDLQKNPVLLNELCFVIMERLKSTLKPGVELHFTAWEDDYPILTNEALLVTVLSNLLHNAVKFTSQGSISLECRLSADARQIEISVTDTGIGIPDDKREWIFERFTKVDEFTQGTGLGLAISRLAARHLGGNIKVDPEYKNGCRMCFAFLAERCPED